FQDEFQFLPELARTAAEQGCPSRFLSPLVQQQRRQHRPRGAPHELSCRVPLVGFDRIRELSGEALRRGELPLEQENTNVPYQQWAHRRSKGPHILSVPLQQFSYRG